MGRFWSHFVTITKHRWQVRKNCFRIGLYWQGLTHDLSKYSFSEFWVGVKYYQGTRSPNNAEREATGYSSAWLHHKGRNKHHYEYWIDYNTRAKDPTQPIMIPVPMPDKYIAEMLCDRVAASKVYNGVNYTDEDPLKYYMNGSHREPMHEYTRSMLVKYLTMLAQEGEDYTFAQIKKDLIHK